MPRKTEYEKGLDSSLEELRKRALELGRLRADEEYTPIRSGEEYEALTTKLNIEGEIGRLIRDASDLEEQRRAAEPMYHHDDFEWEIVGYDAEGNPIYEQKPVWFTEATLGYEYALGELPNRLPLPKSFVYRGVIAAEREIGAHMYGSVEGWDRQHITISRILKRYPYAMGAIEKLFQTKVAYNLGALTRLGHLDGLYQFQKETGLQLARTITSQEKDPLCMLQQLEGCYEAAQNDPDLCIAIKDFALNQNIADYLTTAIYDYRMQRGPIPVPVKERLFPELTQEIPTKLPTCSPEAPASRWYIRQVSRAIQERCTLFIEA